MARNTNPKNADDPFADCELGPDAILGTHEYSGRLYSPEKAENVMNVDVRTGEATHEIPPVDAIEMWMHKVNNESRVKSEEKDWHDHTPQVALVAANGEQLAETRSLVSHAAFFHYDITGSLDVHFAYSAAHKSDDYAVTYETDYEQGTVTITVAEVEEAA